VIGAVLVLLLAACGPADFLYVPAPVPLHPTPSIPAWEPVAGRLVSTPTPAAVDLAANPACLPPCWQSLEPGVTDAQEVRLFLEHNDLVGEWEAELQDDDSVRYRWAWRTGDAGARRNVFFVRDGLLHTIQLFPGESLNVYQMIERFGPPANAGIWTDAAQYAVFAMYPEMGLSFTTAAVSPTLDGNYLCPNPMTAVDAILYTTSGTPEALHAAAIAAFVGQGAALPERYDWNGMDCLPLPQ
jgi:hypothetical protein